MSPRAERIAELNDLLRETFLTGQVILTPGVQHLPSAVNAKVLIGVMTFSAFDSENDPHGERDFGALDIDGAGRIFWKIDYYDLNYRNHSPDASDPSVTNRVLTVMLAQEY